MPAEWIAAHAFCPSRIIPKSSGGGSVAGIEGICPYVRGFIDAVTGDNDACGIVVTTVCDQMRRAADIIRDRCGSRTFLMNVPNTWHSVASEKLYADELKRLGRFLIQRGGQSPSAGVLAEIMLDYDTKRRTIQELQGCLTSRQYSEAIAKFNREGNKDIGTYDTCNTQFTKGIPLAIIGGPLLQEDFEIFDVIEDCGGSVVLDATETGERGMCAEFDRRRLREDPLTELCCAYFGSIVDASQRPNSKLYRWLKRELADRDVRGIIFHRYVWCDIWHGELRRLKEWTELPVLDVDSTGDVETHQPRIENRIRAFLEILE